MCIDCNNRLNCIEICPTLQDALDEDYVYLRGRTYTEAQMEHLYYHAGLEGIIAEPTGLDEMDWEWVEKNINLSEKQAGVFYLYYIYGQHLGKIALKLGCGISNTRNHLHAAQLAISNHLKGVTKHEWSSDEIKELRKNNKSIHEITLITGLSRDSVYRRMNGKFKSGGLLSTNTSGHTGVHWEKGKSRWLVRAHNKYVGRYDNLDDAVKARECAVAI